MATFLTGLADHKHDVLTADAVYEASVAATSNLSVVPPGVVDTAALFPCGGDQAIDGHLSAGGQTLNSVSKRSGRSFK
eukprot:12416767-Karenia_brevis.AAC.1